MSDSDESHSSGDQPPMSVRVERATIELLGNEPIRKSLIDDTHVLVLAIRTNRIDLNILRGRIAPEHFAILLMKFFPTYLKLEDLVILSECIETVYAKLTALNNRMSSHENVSLSENANEYCMFFNLQEFFMTDNKSHTRVYEDVLYQIEILHSANYKIFKACLSQMAQFFVNNMNLCIKFLDARNISCNNNCMAGMHQYCNFNNLASSKAVFAGKIVNGIGSSDNFFRLISILDNDNTVVTDEEECKEQQYDSHISALAISTESLIDAYLEAYILLHVTKFNYDYSLIVKVYDDRNISDAIRNNKQLIKTFSGSKCGITYMFSIDILKCEKELVSNVYLLSSYENKKILINDFIFQAGLIWMIDLAMNTDDDAKIVLEIFNDYLANKMETILLHFIKVFLALVLKGLVKFDDSIHEIYKKYKTKETDKLPRIFKVTEHIYNYDGKYGCNDEDDFIDLLSRDGWTPENRSNACLLFAHSNRICYFAASRSYVVLTTEKSIASFEQRHYAWQLARTTPSDMEIINYDAIIGNDYMNVNVYSMLASSSIAAHLIKQKYDIEMLIEILPYYPAHIREELVRSSECESDKLLSEYLKSLAFLIRETLNWDMYREMLVWLIKFTGDMPIIPITDSSYHHFVTNNIVNICNWIIETAGDQVTDAQLAIFFSRIIIKDQEIKWIFNKFRSKLLQTALIFRHTGNMSMHTFKFKKEYTYNFTWKSNEVWEHFSSEVLLSHYPIKTNNVAGVDQGGLTTDLYNRLGKEILWKFFQEEGGYFVLKQKTTLQECYLIGQFLARAVYVDNISPSMDLHPSIIYTICLPALSLIKSDTLVNIMYNPADHSDWISLITTDASAKLTAAKIKSDLQIRFEDQSMQLASLATGFNDVYMNVCDTARRNYEYISEYITPVPLWNALSGKRVSPDDFMMLLTIAIHSLDESLVVNYSEAFPEALAQLSATEFSEFCRFCTGSYRPTSTIKADIYPRDDLYIRSHTCANSFDVPHKSCETNHELAVYLRDMIRRTIEQQLRQEADGNGFTLA